MRKKEEGITLVALMITIIVLIILAAVTIKSVYNHAIVGKATEGTEEYAKEQKYELGEIDNVTKILNDFEEKMNPKPIDKEKSYVGYYADIEGDGKIDGIIYADLAKGDTVSGQWGNSSIPVETGTKDYYVSRTNYEGTFGTKDVLTPIGSGKDRFYIMALEDFIVRDIKNFYWYYNAHKKLDLSETSEEFGTGKENTRRMLEVWKDGRKYGVGIMTENKGSLSYIDVWGAIESKVTEGWFIPSRKEWSAFEGKLGITMGNYASFGLSEWYWSSSQLTASTVFKNLSIQRRCDIWRLCASEQDFLIFLKLKRYEDVLE